MPSRTLPIMTDREYDDAEMLKRRERYQFWTGVLIVTMVLATAASFCLLLYAAYVGNRTRAQILDCTEPNGQCYQENRAETGKAVAQIVNDTIEGAIPLHVQTRRIVIAAASCAQTLESPTVDEIRKCVDRELEADDVK